MTDENPENVASSTRPTSSNPPAAARTFPASREEPHAASNASPSNLLFLNYSNPSEFKSRSNKRIVKRWASTTGQRSSQLVSDISAEGLFDKPVSSQDSHIPRNQDQRLQPSSRLRPSLEHESASDAPSHGDSNTTTTSSGRSTKRKFRESSGSSSEGRRVLRRLLPASLDAGRSSSVSPIDGIEARIMEPLNVLPVKANAHAHGLLQLYLDAQLLSPSWNTLMDETGQYKKSIVSSRKNVWFPLVRDSAAAFAALVAFIETTPGLITPTTQRGFLEQYQGIALRKANEELASAETATNDSTLFAIVLLMIAAQRTNDLATFRIHARGLSLLLQKRREARSALEHLDEFDHCYDMGSTAEEARLATSMLHKDAYDARNPLRETDQSSSPAQEDFYALYRKELLSENVCYFHAFAVTLIALGLEARGDHLAASSTAQHMFLEGVQPLPPMTSLESACLLAIRLTMHCLVLPLRPPDDKLTLFCVMGIVQGLQTYGVPKLMAECPAAVVWLGMVAGSQLKGAVYTEVKRTLVEGLKSALQLLQFQEFEDILDLLGRRWLWAPTMVEDATVLWTEMFEGQVD